MTEIEALKLVLQFSEGAKTLNTEHAIEGSWVKQMQEACGIVEALIERVEKLEASPAGRSKMIDEMLAEDGEVIAYTLEASMVQMRLDDLGWKGGEIDNKTACAQLIAVAGMFELPDEMATYHHDIADAAAKALIAANPDKA